MRKLVLRSFRGRKRELRISIIMLVLIFACGILTILFQESFYRSRETMRYDTYGEWTGAVFGADEETVQLVQDLESTKRTGTIVMQGDSWQNGERVGKAGYVDQNAQKLGRIQMLEGTFPADPAEAALSQTVAERLPGHVQTGDKIELSLAENGETKTYTVSGIVKPWGREWQTQDHDLPGVILGTDGSMEGETYLLFQNDNPEEWKRIQSYSENSETGVYVYNEKAYPLDTSTIDAFFQDGKFLSFLVLIAVILICYLMMLTLKFRRYSLTILRGLGADAKEVLQLVWWEMVYLWGIALIAGALLGSAVSVITLWAVHRILKMPFLLEIQWKFLLGYIACVTIAYFVSNLAIALTVIFSQIQTTFKADSGLLDRSKPPKLKEAEPLTYAVCLKRKWSFYRKIYSVRFVISILVTVLSAVCLQHFIEEKNQYNAWMESMEYDYNYFADRVDQGLTEEQIGEIAAIPGVKSVDQGIFINTSTMESNTEEIPEIRISAPAFKGSTYVDTHRKYSQKSQGIPTDKEGDYFSVWELRGINPQDEAWLSTYETGAGDGTFDQNRFASGAECVLILSPYQIRDLGGGPKPEYISTTGKDESKKVYTYETGEHAIAPGDTLTVTTPWGEREIQVGTVITSSDVDIPTGDQVVIVSERFVNLLCGFENPMYTSVEIHLDESADLAATGERIEGYFDTLEQGSSNLSNSAEAVKRFAETSLFEGTQYLFLLTAIWLIYMLMMYQGNQVLLKNEGKRIGILRSLGTSKSTLRLRYVSENLCEGMTVVLLSFLAVAAEFFIRLREQVPYDSLNTLKLSLTDNPEMIRLFFLALLIAGTVFLGVSAVTLYLPLKRISGRSITENLGVDVT